MKKVFVAWECSHCGKRHMLKWSENQLSFAQQIDMYCHPGCGEMTVGVIAPIAFDTWALVQMSGEQLRFDLVGMS